MYLKRGHLLFFGVFFGIILLFFVSRLFNILSLPIFTDEAIYVRWAQIAAQDANWRFISLVDGKQPMYVKKYGKLELPNCNIIDERGIYVPNHPLLELGDIKRICDIIIKNDK